MSDAMNYFKQNGYIVPTIGTYVKVIMSGFFCTGEVIDSSTNSFIVSGNSSLGYAKCTVVNINQVHSWTPITVQEHLENLQPPIEVKELNEEF